MKQIFLFSAILLFAFSCQNDKTEQAQPFVFEEFQFVPDGEEQAKAIVFEFLATLPSSLNEVNSRTTFTDTEVNEARWVLEGSANYLKNSNFSGNTATHTVEYNFSVSNATSSSVLKMVGADMTTQFAQLITDIEAEEVASGTVALAVDMKLEQITSSSSNVSVIVAFGKTTPTGGYTWPEAASIIALNTFEQLINVGQGCVEWIPETYIYHWSLNDEEIRCIGEICLSEGFSNSSAPSFYNTSDIVQDITDAIDMGNYFVDEANQGTGGAAPAVPYSLKGVLIGTSFETESNTNGQIVSRRDYHFISSVIAKGYSYCY